eukprot:CAMPEP_0197031052 /NCGR_PEP_ID=MMETSP1384-20130603/10164_1 /TAXON_ID=29189 /ORGANISM="Ammonia sp." /LENGTH=223 /DNA_ID=CAMNT_0042460527 /DNA_START=107 /DNA_END=775 /DNA_ORIENTATION=-
MDVPSNSMLASFISKSTGIELDMSFKYTSFRFPFWGLLFYLISIHLTAPKSNKPSTESRSVRTFGKTETVMFLHNVVLAVFSALTFINTAPIIYDIVTTHGIYVGLCSKIEDAFTETSYGFWTHLFYLSKFYEFVDTWIVIARGRRPITLQVFHHVGAVLGLWLILVAKANCSFYFIVENSFIHSIMYTYYACSVIGIKFRWKFIITMLQMWQFIIGLLGMAW